MENFFLCHLLFHEIILYLESMTADKIFPMNPNREMPEKILGSYFSDGKVHRE